jgi:hypothetical protein
VGGGEYEAGGEFEVTAEELQDLREAAARDLLTRASVARLFREVDQLLRDNQALADGLNNWRERVVVLESVIEDLLYAATQYAECFNTSHQGVMAEPECEDCQKAYRYVALVDVAQRRARAVLGEKASP